MSELLSGLSAKTIGLNLASKLSLLLLSAFALCVSCSGKSSAPSPTGSATASTATILAEPTAARTPTPAVIPLSSLSLVYWDGAKGGAQADVYTAAYDGSNPKRVATVAQGEPIDLRGKTLAVLDEDNRVTFIDLTGAAAPVVLPVPAPAPGQPPVGGVSDGRFLDDRTFVFTTATRCGNGPVGSGLFKVDTQNLSPNSAVTKLATLSTPVLSIAGIDSASGVVAVSPTGCDIAVRSINLYSVADGKLLSMTPTAGCGWAVAAPSLKKALVTWRSCNQPGSVHAGIELTAYDLGGGQTGGHDLRSPNGNAITSWPAKLRPDQPQAAVATSNPVPGPGATTSTAFWLLNLNDLTFKPLTPGAGADHGPIAWSPDGRYLLVQTVLKQGVCSYAFIDVMALEMHPLNKNVTSCGTNGDVLGWTALR